jgi:uncharacterized repeat protein (TIGR04076 family)
MALILEVSEIRDKCPVYKKGDKIVIDGPEIILENTDAICIHALAPLLHYVVALRDGADPKKIGLSKEKDVAIEGDTNTVLAGALAASKLHIKVGHVEAGLRSYDRNMPEEINRALADHVSDYLFAPTEKAKENLSREGIAKNKIFISGNTIVDAVFQNLEIAKRKVDILNKLNLNPAHIPQMYTKREIVIYSYIYIFSSQNIYYLQ